MIVEIIPSSADNFRLYLSEEKTDGIKNKTKTGLSIYTGNNVLCGVAVYSLAGPLFHEEGMNLYLEDIILLPGHNHMLLMMELLSFLTNIYSHEGYSGMVSTLTIPDREDYEPLFLACGMEKLMDGNDIITIPRASVGKIPVPKRKLDDRNTAVLSMDSMFDVERRNFLARFGKDIPLGLSPENIPGKLLWDYSYAFLTEEGKYGGFLLSSDLGGGILYIGSMYVEKAYKYIAIYLIMALYDKFFEEDSKKRFNRIMYATASSEAAGLSERLLKSCIGNVREQCIHNFYYKF